jgi:hypothetical protein
MATKGGATTFMATPLMAIRRGAITSKTQKKYNKLNVRINILDEGIVKT